MERSGGWLACAASFRTAPKSLKDPVLAQLGCHSSIQVPWPHFSPAEPDPGTSLVATASLVAQTVKNLPAIQETQVQSLGGKIPWRKEWLPTPVVLPRESHGQRSRAGYSSLGCKESDTTEKLTLQHSPQESSFVTLPQTVLCTGQDATMGLLTSFLLRAKIKKHHGYLHHPQQRVPASVCDWKTGPRSSAQATWRAWGIRAEEKEAEISKSSSWERSQSAVSPSGQ